MNLSFAVSLVLSQLAGLHATQPSFQDQEPRLFGGIGHHSRRITTDSRSTQAFFDQGLAFLGAFNHDEAIRSFKAASEADPMSPMPWWGIAYANGPHINNPILDPEHGALAWEAVKKAQSLEGRGSAVERALIEAMATRYEEHPGADRSKLERAYADSMRKVWIRFPKDPDVGAMFAEAMMDLRPWDLWKPDGSPQPGTQEVVRTLETVLRFAPDHPLANHLYIHTVEASPHPERGIASSDRLRDLQPSLGHMVHMPSHIDVRIGTWLKAITANEKAIEADRVYREARPRQGFYRLYMAHNYHMLAFAAMMCGQSKKAVGAVDTMIEGIPADVAENMAPLLDGFMAMPFEVRVRFGMWNEVLGLDMPAEVFPLARALAVEARTVAYAAKGMAKEARAEQWRFAQAKKKVPADSMFGNNTSKDLLVVAEHLLNGEILIGEGKPDAAYKELRAGVAAEDALRYDEPIDWIQPVRHTLGAALLANGRNAEAVSVYRADLKKLPRNGWSLYGLSASLTKMGRPTDAASYQKQFAQVWRGADMSITSSCMCIPGKK